MRTRVAESCRNPPAGSAPGHWFDRLSSRTVGVFIVAWRSCGRQFGRNRDFSRGESLQGQLPRMRGRSPVITLMLKFKSPRNATVISKSIPYSGFLLALRINCYLLFPFVQFLMPRWAKEITSKEPKSRTQQEIHSIVQLMKQLKGFRRYSSKIQEALCRALKYDW